MSTNHRNASFKRWGLSNSPFVSLPPASEEERQRVFTGRQEEVDRLLNLVERPRGVFLVGLFGVGKSILVLEALRRLNETGHITAYAKFYRELGFTRSVLKKLAVACPHHERNAIYQILIKGKSVSQRGEIDIKDIDEAVYDVRSPMGAIEDIASLFKKRDGTTFFVVVDDLDKGTDIGDINEIIQDTRQLIEVGCTVILPGHPFGSTAALSSSADILNPIPLEPLSEAELVEMMGKYLDLSRDKDQQINERTHPFTQDAARLIAKGIAEFGLTPRIFNFACHLFLEEAAGEGVEVIDHHFISERWADIAKNFLTSLKENDKRHLQIIYGNKRFLSEDTREPIRQIGGELAQYSEVRGILAKLIQENVLIEGVEEGKRKITTNPILDDSNFFFIR
jgi:hypothetical protein